MGEKDLTISDIIPPRGLLMTLQQSKRYTALRLDRFVREGRLDEYTAKHLKEVWAS